MSGPWLKFYPTDWRADPALRMCSIGARGLWMEMLCVMHEAEPRGYLRVNGKPLSDRQLASLAGLSAGEAETLVAELYEAGVFDRDGEDIISRRMVRDEAKAAEDKANGKRGGNPSLKGGVNPPDNGKDKAHKPEARDQINEDATASSKREIEREFNEVFWPAYPLHVGKPNALKAYFAARKRASFEAIMAGARRYAAERTGEDKKYTKQAQGWLSRDGWNDEPQPAHSATSPPANRKRNYVDVAQDRMNGHGSEGIFGAHGNVELIPPGKRESRSDHTDIRGGIRGRFVPSDH